MKYRIAFFSPCEFGQIGTPGTYRIIEEVAKYHEVRVFSPPPSKRTVYWDHRVPLIPIRDLSDKSLDLVLPTLSQFLPDLIYIFNARKWPEALKKIKKKLPGSKVVLDIKTPLLVSDSILRRGIQEEGLGAADLVDVIVTPAVSSVQTWLPGYKGALDTLPLGLDLSKFKSSLDCEIFDTSFVEKTLHLVYASTLHPLRKASVLIQGFRDYCSQHCGMVCLHIYGDGPDKENLQELVKSSGLSNCVQFHGLVSQENLFKEIQGMDGAIGWVPKSIYNDSPSLKVLEYFAAGLPVLATATQAHCELENEGFLLDFCEDTPQSVAKGLAKLVTSMSDGARVEKNLNVIKARDYKVLVKNRLLPLIDRMFSTGANIPRSSDKGFISLDVLSTNNNLSAKPLRIILVLSTLAHGKGGAERILTDLAEYLVNQGHRVYIAYENRGAPAYEMDNRVVLIPYDGLSQLEAVISGACFDVMTVFYFHERNLVPFVRISDIFSIPLVLQECTNPDRLRFVNWAQGEISRARACWEREVVTSVATRIRAVMPSYVASFADFQRPMVRGFPNSAKKTDICAQPEVSYEGRFSILIVNGFKQNKNLKDLVSAFVKVSTDYPQWDLRIVGKEPNWERPHLKDIKKLLCDGGVLDRVKVVGSAENIHQEFSRSNIHVIASLSEGCPTVVLEAMAVGLPSVGFSDCLGTNELIRHGYNGLLASVSDRVSGLAEALSILMSDRELRKRLGNQAQCDAADFSPQKTYCQWQNIFSEAAQYKNDLDRLSREQQAINIERALHVKRAQKLLLG